MTLVTVLSARRVCRCLTKRFDGVPVDAGQRDGAEAGQDVVAQVAAVGGPSGGAGDVAVFPERDPVGQGDASGGGVEVGVGGLVDVDLFAADLGGGAGGVGGVGADGAVGGAEADSVAGAALFYPGHGLLPSGMWSSGRDAWTLRRGAVVKSRRPTAGNPRLARRSVSPTLTSRAPARVPAAADRRSPAHPIGPALNRVTPQVGPCVSGHGDGPTPESLLWCGPAPDYRAASMANATAIPRSGRSSALRSWSSRSASSASLACRADRSARV